MSLRLGLVGTGRWGRKMSDALRWVGCSVVAYDRYNREQAPGSALGRPMRWDDMIGDRQVDALVLCAPPDVTTEAALACAACGKPCIATKPLMLGTPPAISAPLYVDFWRLWSASWHAFKRMALERSDAHLEVALFGAGPLRGFPGSLDYGPHVMAYLQEVGVDLSSWEASFQQVQQGELLEVAGTRPRSWAATFGNGAESGVRWLGLSNGPALTEEPDRMHCTGMPEERKEDVLRAFCRSFVADVQEGFADGRLLRLSCEGMRQLQAMREVARKVGDN